MKLLTVVLLTIGSFVGGMACMSDKGKETQFVYQFGELETKRHQSKKSYLPFLNVSSMHCGIYTLAAGAKDGQQPHAEDEVYYVQEGVAKIRIRDKDFDVKPGSIVFVPAKAPHHFHSIKKDLKTLVFFSKGLIAAPSDDENETN